MRYWTLISIMVAACLLRAEIVSPQANGEFEVAGFRVDGGGGTSVGGAFELKGAIGRLASDAMTGGEFELSVGIFTISQPGVCDWDGDVDLADLLIFQECFTGVADLQLDLFCQCSDLDADDDVDLSDFVAFQSHFTGTF